MQCLYKMVCHCDLKRGLLITPILNLLYSRFFAWAETTTHYIDMAKFHQCTMHQQTTLKQPKAQAGFHSGYGRKTTLK